MGPKHYSISLISFCMIFLAWFLFISFPIEPLSGSGTRIGGYLESEYGWNKPQQAYESPVFVRGESLKDYTEPFDLIVIGDSFSYDEQISWVNRVSIEAKLHSIFLHINHVDIASLLNHPIFLKNPPKYFVVESMEGLAFLRFRRILHGLRDYRAPIHGSSISMSKEETVTKISIPEKIQLSREKTAPLVERMRIGGDYIMKATGRLVFGEAFSQIVSVKIDCGYCFSNTKHNYFLVDKSNFDTKAYKFNYLPEATEGLERLKKLVEKNGRTTFISILFPNKISVYSPYTKYTTNPTSFVPEFLSADIGLINLLKHFRAAVKDRATDLYLPNDHHTGSVGQDVAAREILSVMKSRE